MQRVLLLCPQPRDFVTAARERGRYLVQPVGPDLDELDHFEALELLAELERIPADGVAATKDRSALLAALLAERRGLPGPRPAVVAALQHKPTARAAQGTIVPEATPRFATAGAGPPPFRPPWFVKPAVGRLSEGTRLVHDASELARYEESGYADGWGQLARLAGFKGTAQGILAEELLTGEQVTLEGYVHGGRVTVLGVTDSIMYPGTNSFERFEYPTRLPAGRVEELEGVARRLLPAVGFDNGFFNAEFFVPERGSAQLVEVNARIASQFSALYEAMHGRSSYDALFALACGDDPRWDSSSPDGVAVSYVLRTFEDAFVEATPPEEPGVEILAHEGRRLSESYANDPDSFRLAIVYESGATREEALERARARAGTLSFQLAPL
ncbi:MAG: acetyl-CoA carboxylase biotin carboxylase subunit family protein [Gaiellaceae bacterium]